jgi:endonuclease YncB( thermonuclease family)
MRLLGSLALAALASCEPTPTTQNAGASVAATAYWQPDGDTIHIDLADGSHEKVRLIGADAPEDSPALVECGGKDATEAVIALAPRGTRLRLVADPATDDRDRFGRLLRYVELPDGRDVGAEQLRAGHAEAHVYYGQRFGRCASYRQAEDDARTAHRGIWDTCR